jgi:hypothetical protein
VKTWSPGQIYYRGQPTLLTGKEKRNLYWHVLPVLLTSYWMLAKKEGPPLSLKPAHLLHVYTWIGLYYALVGKGFDCQAQYVKYPWRRQVCASVYVPLLLWCVWNRDVRRHTWSSCALFVLSTYYLKEWYDLTDQNRVCVTQSETYA